MIQKKVCMVGLFGTGKSSLVQRFVHSLFSERYLSTVGVKIDRKALQLDSAEVTLVLWDLAGRDKHEDITASYLRGAHAVLYVADGTRRETCDQLPELRAIVRESSAADAAPRIVGIGRAFYVPGSLAGESETQFFLLTAALTYFSFIGINACIKI